MKKSPFDKKLLQLTDYSIIMRRVDQRVLIAADENIQAQLGRLLAAQVDQQVTNLFTGSTHTVPQAETSLSIDIIQEMVKLLEKDREDFYKKIVVSDWIPPVAWDTHWKGERILLFNKHSWKEFIDNLGPARPTTLADMYRGITVIENNEQALEILADVFNLKKDFSLKTKPYPYSGEMP